MGPVVRASVVIASLIGAAGDARAPALPPIPIPGPLAEPRSSKQVGFPADRTMAAIPSDNPQTADKIALGRKLFFDGRLSVDGTVACATCHDPGRAFTDGRQTSIGVQGRSGQRNAPTVLNALYNQTQFWDGRAKTLEDQAALPIVNPVEMGQPDLEAAVRSLAAYPDYQQAFQMVFGRPPNGRDLLRAIASYERTLTSFDSPFDRFLAGDARAINESAKRGWVLFNDEESEIDDLVIFMASLTSDPWQALGKQELARQRALARTNRPFRDTRRAFRSKP